MIDVNKMGDRSKIADWLASIEDPLERSAIEDNLRGYIEGFVDWIASIEDPLERSETVRRLFGRGLS